METLVHKALSHEEPGRVDIEQHVAMTAEERLRGDCAAPTSA